MTVLDQSRKDVGGSMSRILSAKTRTKIGTWNTRTLYQTGKLAQLLREFNEYKLDILGISEMRWTGSGKINDSGGTTLLYSGHQDRHVYGVGFMLNKEATRALISWEPVSERIITARFQSRHAKTTVVQVYAPTEDAEDTEKDSFYDQLQNVFNELPSYDIKLLIGDFNAQLDDDRQGLEQVIGPFGSARKTTENGKQLQLFCALNGLSIGNTYFQHKAIHKATWRSPDKITKNEIDFICISQRWRSSLRDVRVCRGADIGSDHDLLRGILQIRLKKQVKHEKKIPKPYAVEKLKEFDKAREYQLELQNRFQQLEEATDLEAQWSMFATAVNQAAQKTVGRRRGSRREQWLREPTWKLIDERKIAKGRRDAALTEEERKRTDATYRQLDRQVKKGCRRDRRAWLERKGEEAEEAAGRNDARALYRIVRELTGVRSNSSMPVRDKNGKTLITSDEQEKRWVEHFRETLNQPAPTALFDFDTESADTGTLFQVCEDPITENETKDAIKALKNNKAGGLDEIPAELLKFGEHSMIVALTRLMNRCWAARQVPLDWQRGVIVKLPKKGNLTDCYNWRGITLLSVPGKVFCTVLLRRLRQSIDSVLREEQAGFRSNRSCAEQIFTLRNIIEQCLEFQKPLAVNFIDFQKAFDSVHRESLWSIARSYGIPESFIGIFKGLYANSRSCVRTESGSTEFFDIFSGVRQGCILSPLLFLMAVDFVLKKTADGAGRGIPWTGGSRLKDLDFADDIALLAEDSADLQELTTSLKQNAEKIGLRISTKKTKVMKISGIPGPATVIKIDQHTLDEVDHFTYLGSILSDSGDIKLDINSRIGKASAVFQRMHPIWSNSSIGTNIKLRLYKSVVLPTAIYACETWKRTATTDRCLNTFHQRCLRRILKITWQHRVRNEEVLRRAQTRTLGEIVSERRLRLAGHILRLPDHRPSKMAMSWTPPGGKRKKGRPKTTWRRTLQDDLRFAKTTWCGCQRVAEDRQRWRKLVDLCSRRNKKD